MPPYTYDKCPLEQPNNIRILKLHPTTNPSHQIQCTLAIRPLQTLPTSKGLNETSKVPKDTLKELEDTGRVPDDSAKPPESPSKKRKLNPNYGTDVEIPKITVGTSADVETGTAHESYEASVAGHHGHWTRSHDSPAPIDEKSKSTNDSNPGSTKSNKLNLIRDEGPENYEAVSYFWGSDQPDTEINVYTVGEGKSDTLTNYTFRVRANLHSALKQLRLRDIPRYLWIDAICINQEDNGERSLQVALMDRVYGEATSVCVWLGEARDESEVALRFVSRIVNLEDFDRLVADIKTPHEWAALSKLMKRDWFSRRWVIQEIALAKRAELYCGDDRCDWSDFAVAVSLFEAVETDDRSISKTIQKSNEYNRVPDYLGEIQFLGATRLVNATSNLFRKSGKGNVQEKLLSLEALVSSFSQFQALKAHDTIYSVLALAKGVKSRAKQNKAVRVEPTETPNEGRPNATGTPGSPFMPAKILHGYGKDLAEPTTEREAPNGSGASPVEPEREPYTHPLKQASMVSDGLVLTGEEREKKETAIKLRVQRTLKAAVERNVFHIDYDKDFFDVCKEFLTFTIESEGSLDIICRPWVPSDGIEHHRPSWLVTTENTAFGARPDKNYSRKNADTLVGAPGLGKRNYGASKTTKVTPVVWKPDRPTTGWCFGTGAKSRSMYVEGFVIDGVKEKKPYAADGIILNEWLNAGDWTDDSVLPPEPFWRTLVADRGPNGLNPPTFYPRACKAARNQSVKGGHISTNALIHYGKSTFVAKFARRVQEVIWMRRLIKTNRGLLGLGPEKTKKRDLICILYGCSVPVLLRQHHYHSLPDQPETYYEFIGECYVHGLMDGEAFTIKENEKDKSAAKRIFELR